MHDYKIHVDIPSVIKQALQDCLKRFVVVVAVIWMGQRAHDPYSYVGAAIKRKVDYLFIAIFDRFQQRPIDISCIRIKSALLMEEMLHLGDVAGASW